MKTFDHLSVKIFADGADLAGMLDLNRNPLIKVLTTNPTLMRKAGVKDYEGFAKAMLQSVWTKPISFEVLSNDFSEMRRQALKIRDWQHSVVLKFPSPIRRENPRFRSWRNWLLWAFSPALPLF